MSIHYFKKISSIKYANKYSLLLLLLLLLLLFQKLHVFEELKPYKRHEWDIVGKHLMKLELLIN